MDLGGCLGVLLGSGVTIYPQLVVLGSIHM